MLPALLLLARLAHPVQDTTHLVLVATTDVHGHATDWDYQTDRPFPGGLSRVATVVDSLRARYPGQVVVVDAGDLIQGEPFAAYFAREAPTDPHPVIEAMNLVGYDAATPGNHEFNWGVPTMERALRAARFPYVSANIHALPADTAAFQPYAVLRRGGVRIGITGLTTPGVMVWDRENVAGRRRVMPIPPAAERAVRAMRAESDLAVVLIHSGMDGGASYDTAGVGDENVAAALAGLAAKPDLVVVGHSHREMRDSVIGGVHFVQPRPYAQSVSIVHVDLVRAGGRWRPAAIRAEAVSLADVAAAPRLARQLADEKAAVRAWVEQPLGTVAEPMPATYARAEPTPIVNFIHSVQRRPTGAQLSVTSAFDLRAGFDTGAIRLAEVAALYPYENTLRAIRITGAQLRAFLEQSSRYYLVDDSGHVRINDSIPGYNYDMISGADYEIDLSQPVGRRIRALSVGGRPVRPGDSFTLAINNYRQGGGGGFDMLKGAPVVYNRTENIRDLLVDEIRRLGRLDPAQYGETNWRIVPEAAAAQVRALQTPRPRAAASSRDSTVLRIFATADLHGALLPERADSAGGHPAAGVAALKGLMDSLARGCECATLRLDAGDQMQGTLLSNSTYGRAAIEAMNQLGVDAAAIGNHDLDWTVDTLRARMAQARYPWLAANVFDSATGKRPAWATPYQVLRAGPLRVAAIGYMTAETKTIVKRDNVAGLRWGVGVEPIRDVLEEVRALRPDLTVIVAHAGVVCLAAACGGELMRLAAELPAGSVDLILGGHTHRPVTQTVNGIPILEPPSRGAMIGVADLVRTASGGRELRTRLQPVPPDSVVPDRAMARLVDGYARRTDSLASRVVGRMKFPLGRNGPQYALGNLVADARRNVLRTDVGLVGNGGIRDGLPAGPVTYGQLYEVQPFQNALVRLTLTGAQLRAVLEHALDSESGEPSAHVSGITVAFDPKRPAGRRIRSAVLANGEKLDDRKRYTLATDDFLATGGSGYAMLAGIPAQRAGMLDLETVLLYLRRLPQPVEAPPERRIRGTGE